MSIRNELAQVLETHSMRSWDSRRPAETRTQCWCGWAGSELRAHQLDVILARFAVVELPAPDGHAEEQPYWDSTDYVEAEDRQVYFIGGTGYRKPNEARDLAGALLAAANHAEVSDVDR